MVILDEKIVSDTIADKSNKGISCYKNKEILHQLSYNSNAVFNHMALEFSAYESAQIIQSNDAFIKAKNKNKNKNKNYNYNDRQIVMVDLGLNFNNLSYRHPCIIIKRVKDKLFVVPCKSGAAPRFEKENVKELREGYLEGDENDGFDHLTTILLKEASCIDISQVISPISTKIDNNTNGKNKKRKPCKITSEKYAEINNELHKLLFSWHNIQMKNLEDDLNIKKTEFEQLKEENERLKEENKKLQEKNLSFNEAALD